MSRWKEHRKEICQISIASLRFLFEEPTNISLFIHCSVHAEDDSLKAMIFVCVQILADFLQGNAGSYSWREAAASSPETRESDGFEFVVRSHSQGTTVTFSEDVELAHALGPRVARS